MRRLLTRVSRCLAGFRPQRSQRGFLAGGGARRFCATAPSSSSGAAAVEDAAPSEVAVADSEAVESKAPWTSQAIRDEAMARHRHIKMSPRKLNDICRPIRGLSVEEALIQTHLNIKPKSIFVENAIKNARNNAVNNFNMDPNRLYISEILVGKGKYLKRIRRHAKRRFGIMSRYFAHLTVKVREQPYREGEVRIGRRGPKITTRQALIEENELALARYKSILDEYDV